MILPNKIEPIEPNYDEIDAIILLERWYDEWSKDEDWWSGGNTWDLNVFNNRGYPAFEKVYYAEEVYNIQLKGHTGGQSDGFLAESVPDGNYVIRKIPIREILSDAPHLDLNVVGDIKDKLSKNIDALPPIVLEKNKRMRDGSHRLQAFVELGYEMVDAFVPTQDGGHWTVNVYGLEQHSTSEHPSTDTTNELDKFELKL